MKKLVIILAITIMLFATQEQRTEQSSTVTEGIPLNAAMEQREELPETHTEQVEKTTESNGKLIPAEATKKDPAVQETPLRECTDETKRSKVAELEETVECVDEGDQTLAEYKSQSSEQPNPFENAPPAEIVDHPVEYLIGEGEDRPGEGKHF